MNYVYAEDPTQPHVGGNIFVGDPCTHSPKVWDYLVDRFAIKSMMDLCSGMGYAASYFLSLGVPALAVDGLYSNARNAVYPTIHHDLTHYAVVTRVDLVICIETVEHIEARYLSNVLGSLACGKFVVLSHAFPNQGGFHHVNCQSETYWIENMANHGFSLLDIDTQRVRVIAGSEGAEHLARSGLVFYNKNVK